MTLGTAPARRAPRHRAASTAAGLEPNGEDQPVRFPPRAVDIPAPKAHALGPLDSATPSAVRDAVHASAVFAALRPSDRKPALEAIDLILEWLLEHDGHGWQERWDHAVVDSIDWFDLIGRRGGWAPSCRRANIQHGVTCLLLTRCARPSLRFLRNYNPRRLYELTRRVLRPDLFAEAAANADRMQMRDSHRRVSLSVLTTLVLHTGRDLDQLVFTDFLAARQMLSPSGRKPIPGITAAWDMARGIADIPDLGWLQMLAAGQRSTEDIVDWYGLRCTAVRDVIVRYLDARRPTLDYSTFNRLARTLASFWADLEAHHPGIDSLHLPDEVAEAWRQRIQTVRRGRGISRQRLSLLNVLVPVRAFYLDIAQWALTDPSWAPHAVPCPVRRVDTYGYSKAKKETESRIHQRIRDLLPHLDTLVDTAHRHRSTQEDLLRQAAGVAPGHTFTAQAHRYRVVTPAGRAGPVRRGTGPSILVTDLDTGDHIDLTRAEDDAFWGWAIIETLRHTGARLEELLEITQLALSSYELPDTGEVIPLLQIVPSKNNRERLLLVSPELASVLATIISRIRRNNDGEVPVVARYDNHERVWSTPLPLLFQRIRDHRRHPIGYAQVNALLRATWKRAQIRDTAGNEIHPTAHDFRRMFATQAISDGLPIHIAAKVLGHARLSTTQGYHAVFQDDVIRAYRTFLDNRRSTRQADEYREPTPEEWREFHGHFALRKVELGDCGRPYGSPCSHEHACVRCPMLRIDPRARARLESIIANLRERLDDARRQGWRGEEQGLSTSLTAAVAKLERIERTTAHVSSGTADLGIPPIRPSNAAPPRP